ncbi:hypothetical protein Hdeb2414_s0020g00554211 [Helianthus debilis subsp. tardiflorus]
MEKKLKGIKLGNNSLQINLARFAKESGPPASGIFVDKGLTGNRQENPVSHKVNASFTRQGCSYSMALNVDKGSRAENVEVMIDASVKALGSRHNKSIIARTRDFNTLVTIKHLLAGAGNGDVEIQNAGGFNHLLVFGSNSLAADFLKHDRVSKVWFSHADLWVGKAIAFERVAWLRVRGVTLHLFCDEVLSSVCGRFGIVVKPPQISEDDGDLSMVCVGVLVGEGSRIIEEITLSWQD